MSEDRKIAENVWKFLSRASDLYGRMHADRFGQEMHSNMLELGLQSPIEDLFWIACHVLCESEYVVINPEPVSHEVSPTPGRGVFITPQAMVGSYRVDFLLSQNDLGPEAIYTDVVVEVDGHDFHDKDQRQRSYEKARDRFLVKHGLRVLHFTGSEVFADPFRCAREALELVGVFIGNSSPYDPTNPIGVE